jgi:hypothetical protein
MLDPWIIEEILKKEEELRREQERNRAELPVPPREIDRKPSDHVSPRPDTEGERGVVIIDI